eukprot:6172950-Pleurochrysis_carterae.AAC.4
MEANVQKYDAPKLIVKRYMADYPRCSAPQYYGGLSRYNRIEGGAVRPPLLHYVLSGLRPPVVLCAMRRLLSLARFLLRLLRCSSNKIILNAEATSAKKKQRSKTGSSSRYIRTTSRQEPGGKGEGLAEKTAARAESGLKDQNRTAEKTSQSVNEGNAG